MIQEIFLNKGKVNTNCLSAITTCFTITMSVTGFTRIPRNVFEQIQNFNLLSLNTINMLYSLQYQWLVLSKPLHWNKRSVIESHFGAIPSAVSWFLSMKFLHFYHPYSIPIFKLSIIYLHSLFTFTGFLTNFLKIFLIKIILREAIVLLPVGWLLSLFTPSHEINPFQANFPFLYPREYPKSSGF